MNERARGPKTTSPSMVPFGLGDAISHHKSIVIFFRVGGACKPFSPESAPLFNLGPFVFHSPGKKIIFRWGPNSSQGLGAVETICGSLSFAREVATPWFPDAQEARRREDEERLWPQSGDFSTGFHMQEQSCVAGPLHVLCG